MRRSPPVRISRSGSGIPANARRPAIWASSMSAAARVPGRRLGRERAAGLGNVPSPPVGHGHHQPEPGIARGQLFRALHAPREFGAQQVPIADEAQPHLIAVQVRHFALQGVEKQLHEHADLVCGPAPILAAECEQRQITHLALDAFLHHPAHHLEAGAMSGGPRQAARSGPPAVAVHDDCDMLRRVGHLQTCINSFSFSAMA